MRVLAAPKASRDIIEGPVETAQGAALKVRVTAPPDRGKANHAILKLLAKTWRLPPRQLTIVAGETDRHKTVLVAGEPGSLATHLKPWLGDPA